MNSRGIYVHLLGLLTHFWRGGTIKLLHSYPFPQRLVQVELVWR